jgi:hypothetical protein
MSDFSITLVRQKEKNEKLGRLSSVISGISILLLIILLLRVLPAEGDWEYDGMEFLQKWKWESLIIFLVAISGILISKINKKKEFGKLIFMNDRILQNWNNSSIIIEAKEIKSINYRFIDISVDEKDESTEKHWITIKLNSQSKEIYEEILIGNDQIEFIKELNKYKNRGVQVGIEPI